MIAAFKLLIVAHISGILLSQSSTKSLTKNKSPVCPSYNVVQISEEFQSGMGNVWIVTNIIPKGKSVYQDGSPACGLHNFTKNRCKCLRYSISVDENDSIIRKTIGLEKKSRQLRYIEDRLVFIEDYLEIFQAQFLNSALIDFEKDNFSQTSSPIDEELFAEYQPFALLGSDNYENYAVYVSCSVSSSDPLVWVAFTEKAFNKDLQEKYMPQINEVLRSNSIDPGKLVAVDQRKCRSQSN